MRRFAPLVPIVIALSLPLVPVLRADPPGKPGGAGKVTVFTHATIHTATEDKPIDDGYLMVRGGKIAAVGKMKAIEFPADAEVVDLKGATVIPGLVDTHSHVGVYSRPGVQANSDGNEMSGPVQPSVRAIDSFNPDDPGIKMALAGGITTANVMPGSGNVIGGQTVYVKYRGRSIEEMRVTGRNGEKEVVGGLKMANGENPKGYGRSKQQAPFTRMKIAALQREQFVKAREYKAKKDGGGKDSGGDDQNQNKPPPKEDPKDNPQEPPPPSRQSRRARRAHSTSSRWTVESPSASAIRGGSGG